MAYTPSATVLDNYARVLVDYALNRGRGVKKGQTVFLQVPESAKPLMLALNRRILASGAHPLIQYLPDGVQKDFYNLAQDHQLMYFPHQYLQGRVRQADHFLSVIAETDKHELEGIDPQKIIRHNLAFKPYIDWRQQKEAKGKLSWTLGLYPTQAMADEAGLSLVSCWHQVIRACFLDYADPIAKWQRVQTKIEATKKTLNSLPVTSLRLQAKNTDLTIGLDSTRRWLGGDGCNIPSFEIFISPDWRRTQGQIYFDMPLYRYGHLIKDITLNFKDGLVTSATASQGQTMLREIISAVNADKVGEFSLTDRRLSRINKFMAETLYDENFGGDNGNVHLALGSSFSDSYTGQSMSLTESQWQGLGFNQSAIHTDIIATTPRTVTATLKDGTKKLIYHQGRFVD